MKDFDQKIFVSKGFLDWLTLSGSDPLKTVIHSSILFTGFYITKMGWKELKWKILTQNLLFPKDFLIDLL